MYQSAGRVTGITRSGQARAVEVGTRELSNCDRVTSLHDFDRPPHRNRLARRHGPVFQPCATPRVTPLAPPCIRVTALEIVFLRLHDNSLSLALPMLVGLPEPTLHIVQHAPTLICRVGTLARTKALQEARAARDEGAESGQAGGDDAGAEMDVEPDVAFGKVDLGLGGAVEDGQADDGGDDDEAAEAEDDGEEVFLAPGKL